MPKFTEARWRFEYRIAGIPCQIAVTDYEPYDPGCTSGPPEHCYPPEGGYGDYRVLDRKGYLAEWLERKIDVMTEQDIQDAIEEYIQEMSDSRDDHYDDRDWSWE
jgi:hypothetical protein